MRRIVCCARAENGHAATGPPRSIMNSRRFMCSRKSRITPYHIVEKKTCCASQHFGRPTSRERRRERSRHRCIKPSVSVCMKFTSAFSSSSERPSRPMNLVFMFLVDFGAGQHVMPSPGSFGRQRGRTSRVL